MIEYIFTSLLIGIIAPLIMPIVYKWCKKTPLQQPPPPQYNEVFFDPTEAELFSYCE
jgi:hypothetical protein